MYQCACLYVHIGVVESSWNLMARGDAWEGKWKGNWRMEWVVASTLTLPWNMVYPALLPLMRTPRLPAVDWTDAPADLNGLVRFAEGRNLVSARVPSHFKRCLRVCHVYAPSLLQRIAVLVQLLLSLISFDISKFSLHGLSWQRHYKIRARNINTHTTPVLKMCVFKGRNRKSLEVPFGNLAGCYQHFGGTCRLHLQTAI
jgi:hypothetical protein